MVKDCVDGSDEQGCTCKEYLKIHHPMKICDGYPNCWDSEDELGCQRCRYEDSFYCELSKQCIDKSKVCDKYPDCTLQEDERYCFSHVYGDTINYDINGRPIKSHNGVIALMYKGDWRALCTKSWNTTLSDNICEFMGYSGSTSHRYKYPDDYNQYLAYTHIKVKRPQHKLYRRSMRDNLQVNQIQVPFQICC
jgi:hypothetical protein